MNTIKRLKLYLELVKLNVSGTTGELKAFWEREVRKTSAKIERLT